MNRVHFTCRTVPEMAALSPGERERVLVESGRLYRKSSLFWRVWWLGLLVNLGVPSGVWFLCSRYTTRPDLAVWVAVAIGLITYTMWFQVRLNAQLPYIRRYLEMDREPTPTTGVDATRQKTARYGFTTHPWWFIVGGGILFGVAFTVLSSTMSDVPVRWFVLLPVSCFGGLGWAASILWVIRRTM